MRKIDHDLFGNVVVSDTQPRGFLERASTHGDKERFEAVVNRRAAAK